MSSPVSKQTHGHDNLIVLIPFISPIPAKGSREENMFGMRLYFAVQVFLVLSLSLCQVRLSSFLWVITLLYALHSFNDTY